MSERENKGKQNNNGDNLQATESSSNIELKRAEEIIADLVAKDPQILEKIFEDLSSSGDKRVVHAIKRIAWDGPLPPPQIVEEFEALHPGAAKIIIEAYASMSNRADAEQKFRHKHLTRGQVVGALLSILGLALAGYCASIGQELPAAVIGAAALGAPIAAFFKKGQTD